MGHGKKHGSKLQQAKGKMISKMVSIEERDKGVVQRMESSEGD